MTKTPTNLDVKTLEYIQSGYIETLNMLKGRADFYEKKGKIADMVRTKEEMYFYKSEIHNLHLLIVQQVGFSHT